MWGGRTEVGCLAFYGLMALAYAALAAAWHESGYLIFAAGALLVALVGFLYSPGRGR